MKEIEIEIEGRVQGVGFRRNVKNFSDKNNIKGFVMNRDNGSVILIGQGEDESLQNLSTWLKSNPGFSKVDNILIKKNKVSKKYTDFKIIRTTHIIKDQIRNLKNLGKSLIKKESKIPVHIAIIPDGNRRWARKKGLEAKFGHYKSASFERITEILNELKKIKVKYVTFWGFSTENWGRDKKEVDAIFELVYMWINKLKKMMHNEKIRFRHLGRKDRLPKKLVSLFNKIEKETQNYEEMNLQICLDYGGRDEIIRAVNKLLKKGVKKIDEKEFKEYLDTKEIPDPDLVIRTSGEKRISGFMPFQSTYAELYFSEVFFPDFGVQELREAISSYNKRIRRFGKTAKQDLNQK